MKETFQIVFSLYSWVEWDRVLPQAFIVPVLPDGKITYYTAQAKIENLGDYGFDPVPPEIDKALQWVEELSPRYMERYFTANQKKKVSLQQLFADKKVKKVFSDYVNHRMAAFLQHCLEHHLVLCWNLERKIRVDEVRIFPLPFTARAAMIFQKTVTGIQYKLQLQIEKETLVPSQHDVIIINEKPAWVSIDRKVLRIEELPAIRLKPFLQKESLFIPQAHSREFFEKFVLENLQKVDVVAEGFHHQMQVDITSAHLVIRDVFTEDRLMLELVFTYGNTTFSYGDPATFRNKLSFQEEVLTVCETRRDKQKEDSIADILVQHGFEMNAGKLFYHGTGKYASLYHVQKMRQNLHPIDTASLVWDQHSFDFATISWEWDIQMANDWFDVHATLWLGEKQIPFASLFPYIKRKDPFYPVREGVYVLIPDELMAQWSELMPMGDSGEGGIKIPKSRHALLNQWSTSHETASLPEKMTEVTDVEFTPSTRLRATLRPYQIQGVKWMLAHRQNQLGCLLADDMGLGKTLQVIALLTHVKELNKNDSATGLRKGLQLDLFSSDERLYAPLRSLVVLPASLVFNWHAEIKKFAPFLHVAVYTGPQRRRLEKTLETFDVILTTYHTVRSDAALLQKKYFEYIVLDESQAIKNKDSQTFKSLHDMQAAHKISLSGTPIENSLAELWAQMQFINPDVLGTFHFFEKTFLWPIVRQQDEGKKQMLKTLIEPYLLRRTKFQVAPELPEIIRQTVYSSMDAGQAKLYEKEKSAVRNAILDEAGKFKMPKGQVLLALLRLRQIASHPALIDNEYKLDANKFDEIKNEMAELHEAGLKVLVFSSFTSLLAMYQMWAEEAGIPYVQLTGADSAEQRKKSVEAFQENQDVHLFLISLKAGGVGLNLTKADYVFLVDPWWNPAAEEQAISRAHRIGREGSVVVKKFITKDTIEEKILALQEKKKVLAGEFILEDELPTSWDEEDIKELLS